MVAGGGRMTKEFWPKIPPSVICDVSLKPLTFRVYAAIAMYANTDSGECYPSQNTIADDLGVSDRCVKTHIELLIKAGHIELLGRRRRQSKVYRLSIQDRNGCSGQEVKTGTATHQDRHSDDIKTGTAVPPIRPLTDQVTEEAIQGLPNELAATEPGSRRSPARHFLPPWRS